MPASVSFGFQLKIVFRGSIYHAIILILSMAIYHILTISLARGHDPGKCWIIFTQRNTKHALNNYPSFLIFLIITTQCNSSSQFPTNIRCMAWTSNQSCNVTVYAMIVNDYTEELNFFFWAISWFVLFCVRKQRNISLRKKLSNVFQVL